MIVVGVTGKYCAGKSTVSEILAEAGYVTIDVDSLGHEALTHQRDLVVAAFGDEVLEAPQSDGASEVDTQSPIDRKALGRIVFSDPDALRRLERIVHPTMVAMTEEQIADVKTKAPESVGVVVNAAILQRMGLGRLCDLIVFVTAPFFQILQRAKARDGAGLLQVVRRLKSQKDVGSQFSPSNADIYSVENDGDRERLRTQLARFLPGL